MFFESRDTQHHKHWEYPPKAIAERCDIIWTPDRIHNWEYEICVLESSKDSLVPGVESSGDLAARE